MQVCAWSGCLWSGEDVGAVIEAAQKGVRSQNMLLGEANSPRHCGVTVRSASASSQSRMRRTGGDKRAVSGVSRQ